jgi:hypothetical protein
MGRSRDAIGRANKKRRWPHLSDVGSAAVLQLAHRWALGVGRWAVILIDHRLVFLYTSAVPTALELEFDVVSKA